MFRRRILTPLFVFTLVIGGAVSVVAQTFPVGGHVELKKADGTTSPVEGAKVDCYRTDANLGCRSTQTNARGEFTFLGIPVNGQVVLAVSGPGIAPSIYPGVKPGQDEIVFEVSEGDGSVFDEAEVRRQVALYNANPTGELTEEQKKAQAEYEKKVAEITAKNDKIKEKNALIERVLSEGNAAFNSGDYATAIAKYEEGIAADPEFVGSAPVLLNNRGAALKKKAVDEYNAAAKTKDSAQITAAKAKAGKDLSDSLESYAKALTILKGAQTADITNPQKHKLDIANASDGGRDAVRIMVLIKAVDGEKTEAAKSVISTFLEVEADKGKKAQAQGNLASYLLEGGDYESAVAEFKKAYTMDANDPEILGKLGLSLFTLSELNQDASMKQESLNYMDQYLRVAPKDHNLRDGIQPVVDLMKSEGLKPQKLD